MQYSPRYLFSSPGKTCVAECSRDDNSLGDFEDSTRNYWLTVPPYRALTMAMAVVDASRSTALTQIH